MSFDGWFKMNENDYGMDLTFKSPDNSFKSLLSLVPGMYSSSFNNIETKETLRSVERQRAHIAKNRCRLLM
jgi:hypothetical protein